MYKNGALSADKQMTKAFLELMNNGEFSSSSRNAKASIFTDLFERPEYSLLLYKVLHPEDTDITQDDISVITLKNIVMNIAYNDLGILAGDKFMILVEAQSTWSVNILVRMLIYLAYTYKNYITAHELDVYAQKRITVPKPEFYVIYTGNMSVPGEIRFSTEFFGGDELDVEIRAKVIKDSVDGDVVDQYIDFTHIFDEKIKQYGRTQKAAEETIKACMKKNILSAYLNEKNETEVINLMMVLFDDETIMRNHDAQIRREAREKEKENTELTLIKNLIKNSKMSPEQAMDALGISDSARSKYAKNLSN